MRTERITRAVVARNQKLQKLLILLKQRPITVPELIDENIFGTLSGARGVLAVLVNAELVLGTPSTDKGPMVYSICAPLEAVDAYLQALVLEAPEPKNKQPPKTSRAFHILTPERAEKGVHVMADDQPMRVRKFETPAPDPLMQGLFGSRIKKS